MIVGEPKFFRSPSALRRWFSTHHKKATELWVGFHRKSTGEPSITWPESVDEALCVGWIDGIRKRIDETRYAIRFTPRRSSSIWSAINIARAGELAAAGRMDAAGLRAFALRKENRSGIYSYEKRPEKLDPEFERRFKRDKAAWRDFESRPASYRRAAIWWVISAKREPTRLARLAKLIAVSAQGSTLPQFTRAEKVQRKP